MAYNAPSTRSTGDLINATIWNADIVANIIAVYAGGLSITSQAVGDILYASSTTQFARVAAVATGQVLTSAGTGTVPAYSATPALTSVDMGSTTVYGSRAITVDTGGVLNVVLASAAGDDFTVDTDKLVVSGDSGNIGIGTASPNALLDVAGFVQIGTTGTSYGINSPKSTYFNIDSDANSTSEAFIWGGNRASASGGTELMRLSEDGKVGIGTANPATLLDVNTTQNADTAVTIRNLSTGTAAQATLKFGNSNGDTVGRIGSLGSGFTTAGALQQDGFYVQSQRQDLILSAVNNQDIRFWTGASEAMVVEYGGKVGIGTSAPSHMLDVQHVGDARLLNIKATTGANYVYGAVVNTTGLLYWGLEGSSGDEVIDNALAYSSFVSTNSATALHLGTAGAVRMTVAAAGNVGIGTTAPGALLHLFGTDSSTIQYFGSASDSIGTSLHWSYDNTRFTIGTSTSGADIYFETGDGSQAVVFLDSGKVGIGTTAPARLLTVAADDPVVSIIAAADGVSYLCMGDVTSDIIGQISYHQSTNDMRFQVNGLEKVRIASDGDVGIGTSTPGDKLEVVGAIVVSGVLVNHQTSALSISNEGHISQFRAYGADDQTEGTMQFVTSANDGSPSTVAMTVATGGQVLIGDTVANAKMTAGLTINQGATDDEILCLKSSDVNHPVTTRAEADTYARFFKASAAGGGLQVEAYTDTDGSSGHALILGGVLGEAADTTKSTTALGVVNLTARITDGSTGIAVVGSDGNLAVITNNETTRFIFDAEGSGHADVEWVAYSDSRLKKNVETIPYGLDTVRDLDAKIFDRYSGYIDDDGEVVLEDSSQRMIGFIAQEVQPLVPELVKDVDDKSFYSLNVGRFTPILWSAVKELDTTVQEYQARIEALEAALTELQGAQ